MDGMEAEGGAPLHCTALRCVCHCLPQHVPPSPPLPGLPACLPSCLCAAAAAAAGYTHERYREIIHSIRRYMPDASVSGDAIVGFPGETEEQFAATMALVEEVGFDRVNTGAWVHVCVSGRWCVARPTHSLQEALCTPITTLLAPCPPCSRLLAAPWNARRHMGGPGGRPGQGRPPAAPQRRGESGGGGAGAALPGA